MATATLSATLNAPLSGMRLAPMGRILVIEDDGALRKVLRRLFLSEGYEVDVASDAVCGLERLRQGTPAAGSSIYLVRDLQGVIYAGNLRISFLVSPW
jgi:DNA-binding NtrC family response regulator